MGDGGPPWCARLADRRPGAHIRPLLRWRAAAVHRRDLRPTDGPRAATDRRYRLGLHGGQTRRTITTETPRSTKDTKKCAVVLLLVCSVFLVSWWFILPVLPAVGVRTLPMRG